MKKDDVKGFTSLISVIFILLVGMAMTGCEAAALRQEIKDKEAVDTLSYVRQHKGEGPRRTMAGSEAELMDMAVKSMVNAGYIIVREPHAVFAKGTKANMSCAFYFYPSQTNNQTEVEVLIASPWVSAEQIQVVQKHVLSDTFYLADINMKLLEKGYDPNVKGNGPMLALSYAVFEGQRNLAKQLINKGANPNLAIDELNEYASKMLSIMNKYVSDIAAIETGSERKVTPDPQLVNDLKLKADKANLAIKMLNGLKSETNVATETASPPVSEKSLVKSDVDKPFFGVTDKIMGDNDMAVVIGVEKYQDLPASDYSSSDAKLMKEYLVSLGVKERNIELLLNERATQSSIKKTVETWLPNRIKSGSKVVIYYSGHGAPDAKTGDAYIVPFDGDPNYLEDTGYPLKRLYDKLGKLQVAEVIVLLDSCFSGAGGRSVLAKGARPLVMMVDTGVLSSNMAVLSATQGMQISTSSPEKGHGVFTYYFLKALKDGKKDIAEIYSYIKPLVEDEAKQINVQQSPSISPDAEKIKGRFSLRK